MWYGNNYEKYMELPISYKEPKKVEKPAQSDLTGMLQSQGSRPSRYSD